MKKACFIVLVGLVVFVCGTAFAGPAVVSGVEKQKNVYRTMIPSDPYQADFSIEEDFIEQGDWLGTWVVYYKKIYLPELTNLLSKLTVEAKYESGRGLRDVQAEPIEEMGSGFVCIPFVEVFHYPGGDVYEYIYDWAGKPAYIVVGEYVKPKLTSPILRNAPTSTRKK